MHKPAVPGDECSASSNSGRSGHRSFLGLPIYEHLLEHTDRNGRHPFRAALGMGMKVGRFEGLVFLGIAVAICQECHDGSRVIPVVMAPGFGHPDQFPQRQEPGVDAEESGEFPNEAIALCATDSGSNSFSVVSA